jgi:hypothetical protein
MSNCHSIENGPVVSSNPEGLSQSPKLRSRELANVLSSIIARQGLPFVETVRSVPEEAGNQIMVRIMDGALFSITVRQVNVRPGVLRVTGAPNYREGTGRAARAALLISCAGKTVAEYLAAGGDRRMLGHARREGWAKVEDRWMPAVEHAD